jgi:hypothetical protein
MLKEVYLKPWLTIFVAFVVTLILIRIDPIGYGIR